MRTLGADRPLTRTEPPRRQDALHYRELNPANPVPSRAPSLLTKSPKGGFSGDMEVTCGLHVRPRPLGRGSPRIWGRPPRRKTREDEEAPAKRKPRRRKDQPSRGGKRNARQREKAPEAQGQETREIALPVVSDAAARARPEFSVLAATRGAGGTRPALRVSFEGGTMQCPLCHRSVRPDYTRCPACGALMPGSRHRPRLRVAIIKRARQAAAVR